MSNDTPKHPTNKAQNLPETRAGLPVPTGGGKLPALTEYAQLTEDLDRLREALQGSVRVGILRELLPREAMLRARWADANRTAGADVLPAQIYRLVLAMPAANSIDQDLFTETICEDVAELRPTNYELWRACRAIRTKHSFIAICDLIKEIRRARNRSREYSDYLTISFAQRIEEEEKEIARREAKAREEEREEREKRERWTKYERRLFAKFVDEHENLHRMDPWAADYYAARDVHRIHKERERNLGRPPTDADDAKRERIDLEREEAIRQQLERSPIPGSLATYNFDGTGGDDE